MSRFFSEKYKSLVPYTPGEQPRDMKYIKLNTNESPFPPSEKARKYAAEAAAKLNLYSDPECKAMRNALAELMGVENNEVILTNGSDEVLNFAFMSWCDENTPAAFADITYGFYPVFAALNRVPTHIIPLRDDFSIAPEDYMNLGETVIIANPNAPTGKILPLSDIERIVQSNPDNIVIIDEAYIDFGGESAVPLTKKYKNLLVTGTFSKSRSMAGARLGFGIACPELIADLNTVRYSTNPYNVNSMTLAAGIGAVADEEYTRKNCATIIENRDYITEKLREMGFEVLDSRANFVFAAHHEIDGMKIYTELKKRNILVRHFNAERISRFNRITIGTRSQMDALLSTLEDILNDFAKENNP